MNSKKFIFLGDKFYMRQITNSDLRKLFVAGDKSVDHESQMHKICSAECHNIILAMSNYDLNAQQQFLAQAVMAMMRLGQSKESIERFFAIAMRAASEICEESPFPCQDSRRPRVSEVNYYLIKCPPEMI